MTRSRLSLAFAVSIVIAAAAATACQRDAEPAAAAPPVASDMAPDPSPTVSPVVTMPADAPKSEGAFSAAALAGTYEGEGILTLAADGTYTFTLGDASDDGTWGMDGGDPKRLRFDPNSKSLQDHVLEVVSNDELRPTAADGSGMASGAPFKRIATP